jgi:hypothetical protein
MTTLSNQKTISVNQVHALIKDEVNAIMANARQSSEPLMRVHLEQTAKKLNRLYSKLTNDHGTGRQLLDQLAGKQPTPVQPQPIQQFKTLDGNTPFRQISAQIAAQ